jgi:hypothetical protein
MGREDLRVLHEWLQRSHLRRWWDYPNYARLVDAPAGAAGVDLFIADPELTGRGVGTDVLRRFVGEIVFAEPATTCCVADPDVRNTASLRAFAKAGFRVVREFVDPEDRQTHALVCLEREPQSSTRGSSRASPSGSTR